MNLVTCPPPAPTWSATHPPAGAPHTSRTGHHAPTHPATASTTPASYPTRAARPLQPETTPWSTAATRARPHTPATAAADTPTRSPHQAPAPAPTGRSARPG